MVKYIFVIYFFVGVLVCGCATIEPANQATTLSTAKRCSELLTDQQSSFFGQGYGSSYDIAMNNAQTQLSNNISSAIKSNVLLENNMINGVVQTLFESKSELTTDTVPIDGYQVVDTCVQNNEYRVSLGLQKAGYKTTLEQNLLKQVALINQLIAKVQNQDAYYKQQTIKKLRAAYQSLAQSKYLNGLYGEKLSVIDTAKLLYTEYLAKELLNSENNNLVAIKYSGGSFFAKGAVEDALNKAGIKVTNIQNQSYLYFELETTGTSRKVGGQYVSRLQLQLNVKKSQNNDILETQYIGTGVGNSLTSQDFAKKSAQRKLQSKLDYFLANKLSQLVQELKI